MFSFTRNDPFTVTLNATRNNCTAMNSRKFCYDVIFNISLLIISNQLTNITALSPSWHKALNTQLLENFPTFCTTRTFITVFTRALNWTPSWVSSVHTTPSYFSIILHLHQGLPNGLFRSGFSTKILHSFKCVPSVLHSLPISCFLKNTIFWDITVCSRLKVNRSFGGTYRIHFHGLISRARYQR
jgi:hypothetical protein